MIRAVTTPAFDGVAEGGRGGHEAANEVISKTGALMPAKKLSETDKVQAVLDLIQAKGTRAEICNRYGRAAPLICTSYGTGPWKPSRWRWPGPISGIFPGSASWNWSSAEPNSYSATRPWSWRF